MKTNSNEGVTQSVEAGLLPHAISVHCASFRGRHCTPSTSWTPCSSGRLRAPSRLRVRSVNAAHRALTSRSDGSSPSGRTGASMVDSDALNVATVVRFHQPQPRPRRLFFDNPNARDARSLRARAVSANVYDARRLWPRYCEVRRMARHPAVNRRPKGTGGSIPSLAALAVFPRREAPVS